MRHHCLCQNNQYLHLWQCWIGGHCTAMICQIHRPPSSWARASHEYQPYSLSNPSHVQLLEFYQIHCNMDYLYW